MGYDFNLSQSFVHRTTSHEFYIKWTRIGNPDGPAVVFIHGTPWSSVVWHDVAASLASRYSIYLYDHAGFGSSPRPRRLTAEAAGEEAEEELKQKQKQVDLDGSLRLRAEASAALFKHWALKPAHVVAHDNGGLVALRLLLQHEVEFASLCLVDVVALGASGLPVFQLVADHEAVFAAIPPHLVDGLVRGYIKNATSQPMSTQLEDLLAAPWRAGATQGPDRFLNELVQAHHRDTSDLESEYHRVGSRAPTKIVWGADDAWIPVETAHRLQRTLHAAEVVVVDDAGHLIQYDQPSRLAVELALWLEDNSNK
ncbi:hypothetical protein A1O3_09120 [Capronia epimyces CBS 606.96]|uniref:AB hydrolase-1 domain-containing protein n=1 Tax=Capronia epimyces CBS 606.96 TaxID=1182542 RepID=W9XLW6_9EURO|nr:uncharacterized protein A1O3_09120 [Capronia epimyces CBS 606.96]EXJ77961.1 hypothetical protein A1O3_09120 [Capronia epimyces CBS 606.96]